MNNLTLNIYSADGKTIEKTLSATEFDLTFGTIRKLMKLLKIEKTTDSMQLLTTIMSVWDDVTDILSRIFPEATDDDWNNVKVKELLPAIVSIAKYSLAQALHIPTEKN